MRQLDFPADVLTQIARDRYHHPDPLVQRRMEVLWLKSLHQPHALIAQIAGVSRPTVQRVLRAYDSGGLDAARTFHWKTPVCALTPHQAVLEEEFTARPPHTVGEACERIEVLTGVRRRPTQVREFLRETMGLRWRKTAAIPVPPKLTLEEHAARQAAFLKDEVGAASGRGSGPAANGPVRGRGPFCPLHLFGMPVEQDPPVRQGGFGASTLQCIGRFQRRDA